MTENRMGVIVRRIGNCLAFSIHSFHNSWYNGRIEKGCIQSALGACMLNRKWVWLKNECFARLNDEDLSSFPKWRWILKYWAFTCLCLVPEMTLFSICTREGECVKWKTPCCLPQRSHALLPTHLGGEPGSGLWLQCCTPAALSARCSHSQLGCWGFALSGFIWSHRSIFGMLWRSSCQRLCCLQNEEIIMAEKKAFKC